MSEDVKQVFAIQKIYTKDISFESPNAPTIFATAFEPKLSVDLNVESKAIDENHFNVILRVTATAEVDGKTAFLCEVEQAGIFVISGFSDADMGFLLGAQCPNILFPYAREIVSDLVARGGFPQLLLDPVSFDAMYQEHLAAAAQNAESSQTAQ